MDLMERVKAECAKRGSCDECPLYGLICDDGIVPTDWNIEAIRKALGEENPKEEKKMTTEEAIYTLKNAAFLGTEEALKKNNDAVEMAMDALKRRIPKKPSINLWDKWIECPECGEVLRDDEGLPLGDGIDICYCWSCGQRIDWAEEENEMR